MRTCHSCPFLIISAGYFLSLKALERIRKEAEATNLEHLASRLPFSIPGIERPSVGTPWKLLQNSRQHTAYNLAQALTSQAHFTSGDSIRI